MHSLILKLSDLSENKDIELNIVSLHKVDVKQTSWDSLDYLFFIWYAVTTVEMDA